MNAECKCRNGHILMVVEIGVVRTTDEIPADLKKNLNPRR
jgi:hypothetical protein